MKITLACNSCLVQLCLFLSVLIYSNLPAYSDEYEKNTVRVFQEPDNETSIPEDYVDFSYSPPQPNDSTLQLISKIENLAVQVEAQGRLIDRLDPEYQVRYPIGIAKNIGGLTYIIVLESDEITTQGASINAFMRFVVPQTGKSLEFAANRIPLSASGGINGIAELILVDDEIIELGSNIRLILRGNQGSEYGVPTKVRFDCGGFVDMTINATIEFSKNVFVREDPNSGKQLTEENMQVNFTSVIQSWSDLIVQVSLPPFQIKQLKGFGFEVQQATFDMSDLSNPPGMLFPENYPGLAAYGDFPDLWQGFYLRQAVLRLPPELNDGERIQVLAQNLIVDDAGFTGTFAAENLLTPEDGNIGGWTFAIDRFEFSLAASTLTRGGLEGRINMPIMDSSEYLNYTALIEQNGDFLFCASMPESFKVPLFVATMKVYETSTLTIKKESDVFSVLASLNGQIDVNAPVGKNAQSGSKKGFKMDGLRFENMQVGSLSPYFKPGIWSVGEIGYSSLSGFSISLNNVEGFEQNDDVGLKFTATVNLSGEKYCASTTLKMMGTRYSVTESGSKKKHKLKYKKTELQDLYISVQDAPICLEGYLAIYSDDPVYGDGYAGMVNAKIIKKIGIKVQAAFGEVNDFKYWYAEALADLSGSPLPIFTGVSLYGIGGGAYRHMKQKQTDGIPFAAGNIEAERTVIKYVPDNTISFGFKATVAIGTSSPRGFNAMATFEIVFNENGGVAQAMFYGMGALMKPIDLSNPEQTDAPIRADVYLGMDFQNDAFHGSFKVYVNVIGGMLTGINPGGLAGEMVIHADPNDWYIHVGRPSARIGLKLQIFGFTIQNGSYFMMGTKIEDMPPPPEQVLRILQMPVPENRNQGELMTAKGLAFGTFFGISTGDMKFLIFYARFDMGIGFDIMLSDKGETYCSETGKKIGINGWYAEGQLYAYLEGAIGIDINIFMIKVHQEILAIGAAILLEAKLPNPFWMRGTVGGYYRLLGGRIKGSCKFQLELGKQCTLITQAEEEASPVEGLTTISELTPGDKRTSVDVFTTPQVVFNYQIGQSFSLSDNVDDGKRYRIVLDYFNATAKGSQIIGTYKWNDNGDVLVFSPRDILPGTTSITIEAKVHFEELVNGVWTGIQKDGALITEVQTAAFETGVAPDYIPENNVSYSYPLKDMLNLYKNEYSNGLVQLKWGQEYLFRLGTEWKQYGRFTPVSGGTPVYIGYSYDAGQKKVDHIIPSDLINNTIYKFDLVNIPANAAGAIDANIKQTTVTRSNDIEMQSNVAESTRSELQEKVIYTCYLRTSMFNTLYEKIKSIKKDYTGSYNAGYSPLVFNINSGLDIPEPFDKYELYGANDIEPLLNISALTSANWLKNYQIPFIYADYPIFDGIIIDSRDTAQLGFIPVRNVYIDTYNEPFRLLTEDEKARGITNFTTVNTYVNYNLSPVTWKDYQDLLRKLAIIQVSHPRRTQLLTELYPSILFNSIYPVNVQYKIPFFEKLGTQNIINLNFD